MNARIIQNIYGNWYGYLGNRRVQSFMETPTQTQEQQAQEWLKEQEGRKALEKMWENKPYAND